MNILNRLFGHHSEATPVPATGAEALIDTATISPTEATIATPGTNLNVPEAESTKPGTSVEEKIGSEALELSNQIADTDTPVSTETFDIPSGDNPATSEAGAVDFTVPTPANVVPPLTAEQASEAPKSMLNLPQTEPAPTERTNLNLPQ